MIVLVAFALSYKHGAVTPFVTYEAESGTIAGGAKVLTSTTRKMGDLPSESSGRSCVDLGGGSVEITSTIEFNAVVVRASVSGTGTLEVAVDGASVGRVQFDAKYRGNNDETNHLFDDGNLLLGKSYPAGAKVRVSGNGAVDLIDLEMAVEKTKPDGFEDITDYGAKAGENASPAIKAAVQAAIDKKSKGIWIPRGEWQMDNINGQTDTGKIRLPPEVNSHPTKFEIAGAGAWYSRLCAVNPGNDDWGRNWGFDCAGQTVYYHDFSMWGQNRGRTEGGKPLVNGYGQGTVIENLWIEHSTCGFWIGGSASADFPSGLSKEQMQSKGLIIRNCRIRNTGADGINACAGTTDALFEDVHCRGTGDDSFATWSEKDSWVDSDAVNPGGSQGLTFRRCTATCTWRANGFGIYGGKNHVLENCIAADIFVYHGLMVDSTTFECSPATGTVTVTDCVFLRTSGEYWGQYWAAVGIYDTRDAQVTLKDSFIVDTWYGAFRFRGSTNGCKITNVIVDKFCQADGDWAVGFIGPFGSGDVTFTDVTQCNWGQKGESFYANPRELNTATYKIGSGCNFDSKGSLGGNCPDYTV